MLAHIVGAFIVLVVGLSLVSPMDAQVQLALKDLPSDSLSYIMLSYTKYFFIGAVLISFVGMLMNAYLRSQYEDLDEEIVTTNTNPQPHKQTYAEYVKERLGVERMMR